MTTSEMLPATVLERKAVVYVRQSCRTQVETNLESRRPSSSHIFLPTHPLPLPPVSPRSMHHRRSELSSPVARPRRRVRSLSAERPAPPRHEGQHQRVRARHPARADARGRAREGRAGRAPHQRARRLPLAPGPWPRLRSRPASPADDPADLRALPAAQQRAPDAAVARGRRRLVSAAVGRLPLERHWSE